MLTSADIERFWSKVEKGDCWIWKAATNRGYGIFGAGGRTLLAHRVSYGIIKGDPSGLELDHLCRNRGCCNPEHLEPVTHRENCLRGISPAAINAKKTHCKKGHEYDLVWRDGARWCSKCRREYYYANQEKIAGYRAKYKAQRKALLSSAQ